MSVLLVTYELRGANQAQRHTAIAGVLSTTMAWWHHMRSTWLVLTEETPDDLTERLAEHLSDDDLLVVVGVDPTIRPQGLLPQQAWDWIDAHMEVD